MGRVGTGVTLLNTSKEGNDAPTGARIIESYVGKDL